MTIKHTPYTESNNYVPMQYIAERLHVSKRTVKNMVRDGRLHPPVGKLGKSPVWNKQTIDRHINLGKHLTK